MGLALANCWRKLAIGFSRMKKAGFYFTEGMPMASGNYANTIT
jgi:hypothetical protein